MISAAAPFMSSARTNSWQSLISDCHDRHQNHQTLSVLAMVTATPSHKRTRHPFLRVQNTFFSSTRWVPYVKPTRLRASFVPCASLFGTSDGFGSFRFADEPPNRNPQGLGRRRSEAADSGRGDHEQMGAPSLSAPPSPQQLPPPPTAPIRGAKP